MPIYTCGQGGERAEAQTILRASGEVEAIVCPVHGVLAYLGYKPTQTETGQLGSRAADGTGTLAPCQYSKLGNRWLVRPPRGEQMWIGMPVTVNPDTTITLAGFLDCEAWRGWLENGVWLEEER
jgi:hypothetical protein